MAELYWEAFRGKLGRVLGPDAKALRYLRLGMRPDHAIVARDEGDRLVGAAGFKTYQGALVGGDIADLREVYGLIGALWRVSFLMLLERDIENERFLLDGLFVSAEARGRGVGTALLSAVYDEARSRGYREVRLDVITDNPRARALYEREGFRAINTSHAGPLRHVFGFRSATTMVRQVV
ncbi:GNAT family N-acetyltransferase [Aestuariibius sp. 2305UL40-4]|uniref:GNAT family N-acetyltransferase n=1 Tax=Aestuariibius violaceus TaxID=3234132 RepID=UPI00345E9B07